MSDKENTLRVSKESSIKAYKLNKTFENSVFPIEQELREINNNTVSNTLNNLAGVVFSGVGTSLLSANNVLDDLLKWLCGLLNWDAHMQTLLQIFFLTVVFVVLYFIGIRINKVTRKRTSLKKKKSTDIGRSELSEIFHKMTINDIVTGLSFVNKAAEMGNKGDVAEMYLYEAAYYFVLARIQMEEMNLVTGDVGSNHEKLVEEIGINTVKSTCNVYLDGLCKLYTAIPNGIEKEKIKNIIEAIETFKEHI